MKKFLLFLVTLFVFVTNAQTGSVNNGFQTVLLNTAQISALQFPATGLLVYNTDLDRLQVNAGTGNQRNFKSLNISTGTGIPKFLSAEGPNNGFLPPRVAGNSGFSNPGKGLLFFNTTLFNLQFNAGTPSMPDWKNIVTNAPGSGSQVSISNESPTVGFVLPRVSSATRDLFTLPASGLMIFNLSTGTVQVNSGTGIDAIWQDVTYFVASIPCTTPAAMFCTTATQSTTTTTPLTTTANGGAGGTVSWDVRNSSNVSIASGAGVSTTAITYPATGIYTVTFVSTNNSSPAGCSPAVSGTSCSTTVTVTCTTPTPTINANGSTTFCAGGNVILTSSSTTGNVWSTGATTQSITVSTTGTYTVTTTNSGCTSATSLPTAVTVTPSLTSNFANIAPFCAGTTAPVLNGTSPNGVSGTWSPSTVSNTASGNYVFTPSSSCHTGQTLSVTVNSSLTSNFATIPAFCAGTTAPILEMTSPNGVAGTWLPSTISNTTSGSYVFTPTLACHTGQTLSVTVNPAPVTPTISVSQSPIICSGGFVRLFSSITTGYQWYNNGNIIVGATNQSYDATISGTYTVRTTVSGCTSAASNGIVITVNPSLTSNFANIAPFCAGTTAPVLNGTSPNGVSGTWSPSTVSNTASGNYTFTPSSSCHTGQTLSVTVNSSLTSNFATIPAFCAGTTAPILEMTSPNGVAGTWLPSTISNTTSGSYVFTPTLACHTGQTLSVTVNPAPVTPTISVSQSPIICSGGFVRLFSSITTGYQWYNNGNIIVGATNQSYDATISGTYTVRTTVSGCTSAASNGIVITVNPSLTSNFANIAPFCAGTTAPVLNGTSPNGVSGTWSPSTVSNTASGNYVFTPSSSCHTGQTLSVTVNSSLTSNFATIPAFCAGTTAPILEMTSPNGVAGTWLPSTISNTTSGSYVFTPTLACHTGQTLSVTVNPAPVTPTISVSQSPIICSGGFVRLFSSITTGYQWYNNGNIIVGATNQSYDATISGTYTVRTTVSGCTSAASNGIVITVNPSLTSNFANIAPFCAGTTAPVLNGTSPNGVSGTWSPSTVSNTASGNYTFTPSSSCHTGQTLSVTVNPAPVAPADLVCTTPTQSTTTSVALTTFANGGSGGTITWNIVNSSNVSIASGNGLSAGPITYAAVGNYTVTFTSTNTNTPAGCNPAPSKSCSTTVTVTNAALSVTSLNCSSGLYGPGNIIFTNGVSGTQALKDISYTGGNGQSYTTLSVSSTGVTGLTWASFGGGTVNGSGTIQGNVAGTPNGYGTATFTLNFGGQSCIFSVNVNAVPCTQPQPISITEQSNNTSITVGSTASFSATGGNGGTMSWTITPSAGVSQTSGNFSSSTGSITFNNTGQYTVTFISQNSSNPSNCFPAASTSTTYVIDVVPISPMISALDCGSVSAPTIYANQNYGYSTRSLSVPYTGGNGQSYAGVVSTANSTGVTGLTLELVSSSGSVLSNGAGSLTYYIYGTASSAGTASFNITVFGVSCTINVTVSLPLCAQPVISTCNMPTQGQMGVPFNASVTSSTPGVTYVSQIFRFGNLIYSNNTNTISNYMFPASGGGYLVRILINSPSSSSCSPNNNACFQSNFIVQN